jgi:hypothetical protein
MVPCTWRNPGPLQLASDNPLAGGISIWMVIRTNVVGSSGSEALPRHCYPRSPSTWSWSVRKPPTTRILNADGADHTTERDRHTAHRTATPIVIVATTRPRTALSPRVNPRNRRSPANWVATRPHARIIATQELRLSGVVDVRGHVKVLVGGQEKSSRW